MKHSEGFRKLAAWQKAYKLVLDIYKCSQMFPDPERYGLTSQIWRAAVSVPANIAEGSERQHKKEFLQFLSIARGSLAEVESYLMLAKDLGYINDGNYADLDDQRKETGRISRGLYRSLL